MGNDMNLFKSVMIILVIFIFSACSSAPIIDETVESNEYILLSELPKEAFNDRMFLEPFLDRKASKLNYGFLYVVDENGNPVENLKCYNEGQWYVEDMEGAGKHSSVSMPGGIIPVPLVHENDELFLTIVNEEAESFIYENIEADCEKLLNGEIYKVIWKYESPEKTILKSEDYIEISISSNPEYDISRFTLQVVSYYEEPETEKDSGEETNPAIGMSFVGEIKAETLVESFPQIGNAFEKIKLYYIGNDGTVTIKSENIPETEKIKFIIGEMDDHIIAVSDTEKWEFVFENWKSEYVINLN